LVSDQSRSLGVLRRAWTRRQRSPWWIELLALAWLYGIYDAVTDLPPLRQGVAMAHARSLLHFERVLHIAPELSLNRWLAPHHVLALALSDYYDIAHFVVTIGLLAWVWWYRPDIHRGLRNTLVLTNVIGLVVYLVYPLAPPRLLPGAGFTDVVANTHAFASSHAGVLASQADQFAAMPSLHIAWAAWCTLVVFKLTARWGARVLALLYPVLTTFTVLATANHFLLDVVAGLATLAVAALMAKAWGAFLAARRGRVAVGLSATTPVGLEPARNVKV
jgi:hypothetical protein